MKPILVINPVTDADFTAQAQALIDIGAAAPEALQKSLRQRYPRAVVRARELSSELSEVWYVYREGTWVPASEQDDR